MATVQQIELQTLPAPGVSDEQVHSSLSGSITPRRMSIPAVAAITRSASLQYGSSFSHGPTPRSQTIPSKLGPAQSGKWWAVSTSNVVTIVKIFLALMALVAAYVALAPAFRAEGRDKWSANLAFKQDCEERIAHNRPVVPKCWEVVDSPTEPPPFQIAEEEDSADAVNEDSEIQHWEGYRFHQPDMPPVADPFWTELIIFHWMAAAFAYLARKMIHLASNRARLRYSNIDYLTTGLVTLLSSVLVVLLPEPFGVPPSSVPWASACFAVCGSLILLAGLRYDTLRAFGKVTGMVLCLTLLYSMFLQPCAFVYHWKHSALPDLL